MELRFDDSLALSTDGFGVVIKDDTINIPKLFQELCETAGLRSFDEFLSFVRNFPSSISGITGWSVQEVLEVFYKALPNWKNHISPAISQMLVSRDPPPQFPLGALPPTR